MGLIDEYRRLGNTRMSFGKFAEEKKKHRVKREVKNDPIRQVRLYQKLMRKETK